MVVVRVESEVDDGVFIFMLLVEGTCASKALISIA